MSSVPSNFASVTKNPLGAFCLIGRDMNRVTYSGEAGVLISRNDDEAGMGGENEGLGCS